MSRPRKLTHDDITAIRQARTLGTPVAVLADMYGVHVQTLYRYTFDIQETK
ncbi:Hin recombinase [Rhodococcus ruber]|uniref:helix-turn-helix domain-containing protein n=1 Tax=Rhodococcus ruber TaxID=1830 RepID=UPI0017801116|nr:helix-turn-helix domain-containing protein [Rhodococcus ruber]MBD8056933.1 Hin recombinase [Rhodococcus ruber]